MLLSVKPLIAVASVNIFDTTDAIRYNLGDTVKLYFQLIDASLDTARQGFNPAGRRYVPVSGATLSVNLMNIDNAKAITRNAFMAFPNDDRSMWYVQMQSTDTLAGTVDLTLTLTENGVVTTGRIKAAVLVSTGDC